MRVWTPGYHMPERWGKLPRSVWVTLARITGLVTMVAMLAMLSLPTPAQEPVPVTEHPETRVPPTVHVSARPIFRTAVVTSDLLNIRAAASSTSAILGSLPLGQRVTIVGDPVHGFLPMAYGGDRAWVAAAHLALGGTIIGGERWIDVDRDTATVTLREGSRVVATFRGTVGADRSRDGYYATAPGTFHVYSMTKELTGTSFAEGGYITDWVGFDPQRRNGFHSPIRDESGDERTVQAPTTKGCVRLTAEDAARLFAFSSIGMRVHIHD